MADPTDDINKVTTASDTATKSLNAAKEAGQSLFDTLKDIAHLSFDSVLHSLKDYGDAVKKAGVNSVDLRKNNVDVSSSYDAIASSMNRVLTLTTKFDAFSKLQVQGGAAVTTVSEQFNTLIGKFGGWEQASKRLLGTSLSGLTKLGEEGARALLESASQGQKLENSFINLHAATGDLSKVFDENNQVISNLSDYTANYAAKLDNMTTLTGKSLAEVAAYADQLGKIPHVLGNMIQYTGSAEDKMDGLTLAMTLAQGAGTDLNATLQVMQRANDKLANATGPVTDNGKKGAEMFALISEASKKLNLTFDNTEEYMLGIADHFEMIGDNSQAATNMLSRFSGALQNTGLTAKTSIGIIKEMTESVAHLDMGTKALISSRSGGPGGLQGAFQFENLVRHGKGDQAYGMMEKALRKQLGNRIYTLDDASKSQAGAAQYQRQRAILTSGIFGKKWNEDQANHVLESMQQGSASGIEAIRGDDATKNVVERGKSLQKKQANGIQQIDQALDRGGAAQSNADLTSFRQIAGTENVHGKVNPFAQEYDSRRNTAESDIENQSTGEVKSAANTKKRELQVVDADILGSSSVIPNVATFAKDQLTGAAKGAEEWHKKMKDTAAQKAVVDKVRQQQLRSSKAEQRGWAQHGSDAIRGAGLPNTQLPKASEIVKHEIKPLEVHITVSRDKDTQVTTQTNYKGATIKDIVKHGTDGFAHYKE